MKQTQELFGMYPYLRAVVVDAMDTDIFVLLVYAYSKVAPADKWYMMMKIDKESYVDVGDVCRTYGRKYVMSCRLITV